MAATNLADVSAALSLLYRPQLQSQINSVAVLPYLLPVVRGSGKVLSYTGEFSGAANATATAEGVALSAADADQEIEVPMTLPWAQYTKTSSATDLAQAAVASNFNPGSIGALGNDLLLGRLDRQTRRMALGVAQDLYTGDPNAVVTELAGADLAIASSGAFAGVDPVVNTEWAAHEGTSALAAISVDVVRDFFTSIYLNSGYYPEFCTCNAAVFNAIRNLHNNFDATVDKIQLARGGGDRGMSPRTAKVLSGMRAIEVDNVVIVLDKFATGQNLYAWNTMFVEMHDLPFAPVQSVLAQGKKGIVDLFRRLGGNRHIDLPQAAVEGMMARSAGITPFIKVLGDRGMSSEALIGVFAQVKWSRRNAFGKHLFT